MMIGRGQKTPCLFLSLQQPDILIRRRPANVAEPREAGCRGAHGRAPTKKPSVSAVGADAPGGPPPRPSTPSVTALAWDAPRHLPRRGRQGRPKVALTGTEECSSPGEGGSRCASSVRPSQLCCQ